MQSLLPAIFQNTIHCGINLSQITVQIHLQSYEPRINTFFTVVTDYQAVTNNNTDFNNDISLTKSMTKPSINYQCNKHLKIHDNQTTDNKAYINSLVLPP